MTKNTAENILLFSIDLEDIRFLVPGGMKYTERVPAMVNHFLRFLQERNSKATFFVVGNVAEYYSSLVKEIIAEGHEIGCHTHTHVPLDRQTKESFREDLLRNKDALHNLGLDEIYGFRAPGLSLTEKTKWAHEVLIEQGFKYSSSVMATDSAFHGWPGFGEEFKLIDGKLWELPPTLLPFKNFSIPFASSVYFRFLPAFVSRWALNDKFKKGLPVISYFHTFDIDWEQERFMHPDVNGRWLYNFLMYYHRRGMLDKYNSILPANVNMMRYIDYVEECLVMSGG